jgi:F-type H+-transporting ATPase subunit epsilon
MGILPNHAPLLTTLKYGILKVRQQNEEIDFAIAGGIMEVQPHIVTILADAAENVQEIDVARAEAAKMRVEELLKEGPPPDMDSYLAMEAALKRSNLRLEAARRYRKAGQTSRAPGEKQGES